MKSKLEVLPMEFDKEKLRRMFPRLAEEMETDENKMEVNSVRTTTQITKESSSRRLDGYNPDVVDFIRRCDGEAQAEEIITYMEKRGEIDKTHARKLRNQLRQQGVRSFGSKKEADYYLKHGGLWLSQVSPESLSTKRLLSCRSGLIHFDLERLSIYVTDISVFVKVNKWAYLSSRKS